MPRTAGTPQGGVISPLLANLFLHYAFDTWMMREFPHIPFERYAGDAICHCRSGEEARALWSALGDRLAACRAGVASYADRRLCHQGGTPQVKRMRHQTKVARRQFVRPVPPSESQAPCPLVAMPWQRPNNGSRMNREVHVPFWESPEVKVLRALIECGLPHRKSVGGVSPLIPFARCPEHREVHVPTLARRGRPSLHPDEPECGSVVRSGAIQTDEPHLFG